MIGAGAMGVVYEAIDDDLQRPVAIKLVSPTARSPLRQRRLLREAQAMARLAHPNVVGVYESSTVGDDVFIAMELVDGPSLAAWLAASPRSWETVLRVFLQAGRGVAAAHGVDLVHRDFKPANVLIGGDGRVRVADFGLARPSAAPLAEPGHTSALDETMTQTGALIGTPAYMAPELLAGAQADALSDQFSFCAALYEALYGERPFRGHDPKSLLEDIESRDLRSRPRGRPVPAWVHGPIVRGLGPRERRWPSMHALLQALDLDRRRRRRRFAALGLTLSAAAGLSAVLMTRPDPALCNGGDALGKTWDPATRAALRTTIAGLALTEPETTADAVVDRLDRYAEAWQGARRDACEATRVHREQSEALMDARMRCLDGRAQELRALVGVLRGGDVEVGRRATSAVAALPSVERCADVDYITAAYQPPETPAQEAAIEASRGELATVLALDRAGRFADALATLEGAPTRRAAATDYCPLIAEFALAKGTILDDLGRAEDAAEALEDAYYTADSCGSFSIAQAAALRLVHVIGYRQSKPAEAERWARLAEAKIDYTGDDPARAKLALNRGEALESTGDLELSRSAYTEALALHRRAPDPDPLLMAEILDSLGLAELTLAEHDAATEHLGEALAIWRAELGPSHPLTARGFNSNGNLFATTGRYLEAAQAYEGALAIWRDSKGPESDDVAAMHNNLAVVYKLAGDLGRARENVQRALAIREGNLGPDDPGVAKVLTNLGSLALRQGDDAAARGAYARALRIYEGREAEEDDLRIASVLQGLGMALLSLSRPEEGLPHLRRCVSARERLLPEGHAHLTHARATLVDALTGVGHLREARALLDRTLAIAEEQPAEQANGCRTGITLARLRLAEGDRIGARAAASEGLEDCRTHDPENDERITQLRAWLAEHP